MRFVVFGILDMRWKYRKMVKPQERLFMQSKRLHKESFLWNDLFHDKNKSEPIANRRKVRIYSLWWRRGESNPCPKWNAANIYERRSLLSYFSKESFLNLS